MQDPLSQVDNTLKVAMRGDPAAQQALVKAHGPLVWSLCRRMCANPEDAYQDVWEKVFKALHRFDPERPGSLRSWIATITHRHLVDRHRRLRVRGQVVELREIPAIDNQMDERLAQRQHVARLEAALGRLPDAQRRVVVMHHLQGRALEEIAEDEGVAVGTIKSRLHRGRAKLAALLGGAS